MRYPALVALGLLCPSIARAEGLQWVREGVELIRGNSGQYGLAAWQDGAHAPDRIVVPPQYDWISPPPAEAFHPFPADERAMVVEKGLRYGLIDTKGRELIPTRYDFVSDCQGGMAKLHQDGKVGFADCATGRIVIPIEFDDAQDFSGTDSLVSAVKAGRYGLMNRAGKAVVGFDKYYTETVDGRFGIAYDSPSSTKVLYDDNGAVWHLDGGLEKDFGSALLYRVGEDRYGLVSMDKTRLLEPKYSSIFCSDLCRIDIDHLHGLYNIATRKMILEPKFARINDYGPLIAAGVADGDDISWTFYDRNGNALFGRAFDGIGELNGGRVLVKSGKLWGVIDLTGRTIVPFEILASDDDQPMATFYRDGTLEIGKQSGNGLIDAGGRIRIPFLYRDTTTGLSSQVFADLAGGIGGTQPRFASVRLVADDKQGVLAADGHWAINPGRYDTIWSITRFEGKAVAIVRRGDKNGVVDLVTGRERFALQWRWVDIAPGHVDYVTMDGRHGFYFEKNGRTYESPALDYRGYNTSNGLIDISVPEKPSESGGIKALLGSFGQKGIADLDGKIIVPPQYDYLTEVSQDFSRVPAGMAAIRGNGFGLLGMDGSVRIPLRYDVHPTPLGTFPAAKSGHLENDHLSVQLDGEALLVDLKGNVVARQSQFDMPGLVCLRWYDMGGGHHAVLAEGYDGEGDDKPRRFAMLLNGKLYSEVGGDGQDGIVFVGGLLRAKRDGKWGFLDRAGSEAIPFIYDAIGNFNGTVAIVRIGNRWTMVDRSGGERTYYSPAVMFRREIDRRRAAAAKGI